MKPIHIYGDNTFQLSARTNRKVITSNKSCTMSQMAELISKELSTKPFPECPNIVVSAGRLDLTPHHLPSLDPTYLKDHSPEMINLVSHNIMNPLTYLYHDVTRRNGRLWVATICPRPANFNVNPQVSEILSEAFLKVNHYVSFLNHKQNLPNLIVHQPLQYWTPHPAVTTTQRTINRKMFHSDGCRLTQTARARVGLKLHNAVRRHWGPNRSTLQPIDLHHKTLRKPQPSLKHVRT